MCYQPDRPERVSLLLRPPPLHRRNNWRCLGSKSTNFGCRLYRRTSCRCGPSAAPQPKTRQCASDGSSGVFRVAALCDLSNLVRGGIPPKSTCKATASMRGWPLSTAYLQEPLKLQIKMVARPRFEPTKMPSAQMRCAWHTNSIWPARMVDPGLGIGRKRLCNAV